MERDNVEPYWLTFFLVNFLSVKLKAERTRGYHRLVRVSVTAPAPTSVHLRYLNLFLAKWALAVRRLILQ